MNLKYSIIVSALLFFGCEDDDNPVLSEHVNFINISTTETDYSFTTDPGYNAYILDENQDRLSRQDQLSLNMENSEGIRCDIYVFNSELKNLNFPYILPSTDGWDFGKIFIWDRNFNLDEIWGENDDDNLQGHTYENLEITILSFDDGIIKGIIKGPIKATAGRETVITSGEFEILIRVD